MTGSQTPPGETPDGSRPGESSDSGLPPQASDVSKYDYDQLSGGEKIIFITCNGIRYELKRTKSGRLVLHR